MLRPIYSLSTICYVDFDDLNNKHNIVLSSPTLFSCFLPSKFSLLSLFSLLISSLFLFCPLFLWFSYTLFILTTILHHIVCVFFIHDQGIPSLDKWETNPPLICRHLKGWDSWPGRFNASPYPTPGIEPQTIG